MTTQDDDSNLKPSDPLEVRRRAMDFLSRREHTRDELITKLTKRGFTIECVIEEINRLRAEGLQSDVRFAEAYTTARIERGMGPMRLAADMQKHGVKQGLIEDVLSAYDNNFWLARAKAVWQKKFGGTPPADFGQWSKQKQFLYYRGFADEYSPWLVYVDHL